jgi:hypothetical protein
MWTEWLHGWKGIRESTVEKAVQQLEGKWRGLIHGTSFYSLSIVTEPLYDSSVLTKTIANAMEWHSACNLHSSLLWNNNKTEKCLEWLAINMQWELWMGLVFITISTIFFPYLTQEVLRETSISVYNCSTILKTLINFFFISCICMSYVHNFLYVFNTHCNLVHTLICCLLSICRHIPCEKKKMCTCDSHYICNKEYLLWYTWSVTWVGWW